MIPSKENPEEPVLPETGVNVISPDAPLDLPDDTESVSPRPSRIFPRLTLPAAFASFRHRNYKLWFSGQLISVIGTWMQIIAEGWLVYQLSHSEFALGLVSFANSIPVLLVSPYGGVITDRVPKRTVLVITQSVTMLLAFVIAALSFTHLIRVWHIIVEAVILGTVTAFDAPARQALVVDIVDREDVGNAIALNSITFNGARVVGPAIGGLLLASVGASWCFLLNGLSFIAVIAGLLAMNFPSKPTHINAARPLEQFREGWRYARQHQVIIFLLGLAAIFSIFGTSYNAILPAFIVQVLHSNAAGFGTINTCIGAGALSGALLIAQTGGYGKRGLMVGIAALAFPIILALFAFNQIFLIAMLLAFGLGFGFMLLFNNINSLLQLHVDDAMRGRVMSLYTISFMGLAPFGTLSIGAIAEKLPMNLTIGMYAAMALILSTFVLIKAPQIRRLK